MGKTEDDLENFARFVQQRLQQDSELKLPELFDLWMLRNPNSDDFAENIAAVNAAVEDFLQGERGTPAGEDSRKLRDEFALSSE